MMANEIWAPFPPCPTILVSSHGRIKGQRSVSFGAKNSSDYLHRTVRIDGKNKTFKVHRMVLWTFVGPSNLHTNHKNGVKTDNRLENLEYVTQRENNIHAIRTGLSKPVVGEKNHQSKLSEKAVRYILKSKLSCRALGRRFGVSGMAIHHVRKGHTWRYLRSFTEGDEK